MSNEQETASLPFTCFPERRLDKDFPWQVWAIGWLAILKSILWLVTAPILSKAVLSVLFYKYIIFMVPFFICGIGVWNLRRQATIGLLILCCAELLFFIIYPAVLRSFSVDSSSKLALISSALPFIFLGPLSSIFILIYTPFLFKHSNKGPDQ